MTAKIPLYQTIVDYFQKELSMGKLSTGDQIPTELELSVMFGVSRITVIRAVKELEHLGLVYRVKGKGSFVTDSNGWQGLAESSETGKGGSSLPMLSVVLPFNEQLGYDLLTGVEKVCEEAGLYVTFHNSHGDYEREKEIIEKLKTDRVRGIIVYPCSSLRNIDVFSDLLIRKFPFVIIDRNIEGLETPLVVSNNYQGSYDITQHLIQLGHRKIAFVGSSMKQFLSAHDRYRGYCQALVDAEITLRTEWLIDDFCEVVTDKDISAGDYPDQYFAAAEIILKRLMALEQRPTALVVANDITAMYVVKTALHMGISIPAELSVTGFDNLSFAEHLEVPLTTMEQFFVTMGEKAAAMLVNQRSGQKPKRIVLDTQLIVRNSTSAPASF